MFESVKKEIPPLTNGNARERLTQTLKLFPEVTGASFGVILPGRVSSPLSAVKVSKISLQNTVMRFGSPLDVRPRHKGVVQMSRSLNMKNLC